MQSSNAAKTETKVKSLLCCACLTSDRKLFVLNKSTNYMNIWRTIVQGATSDVSLCWECLALLRNVKKFQEKVITSQNILKETGGDQKHLLNGLSNLSTTQTTTIDYEFKSDKIQSFDNNIKQELEIKREDNHISHDYDISVYLLDDIKEDSSPEISLKEDLENTEVVLADATIKLQNESLRDENLNTEKPFKFIKKINKIKNQKIKIKQETERIKHYKLEHVKIDYVDVYKRLPIRPLEVKYWMEKERNGAYFKSLQSKCVQCAMRIPKKDVKSHKASHARTSNYICDACKCSFPLKLQLVRHMTFHNYIRSCNTCGYKCINKLNMHRHWKQEHSRIVKCLGCDKSFRSTRDFYIHYKEICRKFNKIFICDYCTKQFVRKNIIEKHILRHHTRQHCADCNRTFATFSRLKDHMEVKHRVERTEATYCVQCDKQFDNVRRFNKHFKTYKAHVGERKRNSFKCPMCSNVYAKRITMQNHFGKVHAEVPRFQCGDCGKILLTNDRLKSHIMYVHQGFVKKKDKICTYCGRGFVSKQVLKKHIRTHTGERPYECPHCDASFAQRTPMVTHIKNIHNKTVVNC